MNVYVVTFENGYDYEDYQWWIHKVYDNLEDAAGHVTDEGFLSVDPYRLGGDAAFDTPDEELAFHEALIRLYRDLDSNPTHSYDMWFGANDEFLGQMVDTYNRGDFSLTLPDHIWYKAYHYARPLPE